MKKLLFLEVVLAAALYAQLDKTLLEIEAKLFPKILFLDKTLEEKLVDEHILIHILTEPKYAKEAQYLKKLLHQKRIYNKKIVVKIYTSTPKSHPTAYILLAEPDYLQKNFTNLAKNRIIFSALPKSIKFGMISIKIDTKVYPVINPKKIKEAKIRFSPILFKVAKIYE